MGSGFRVFLRIWEQPFEGLLYYKGTIGFPLKGSIKCLEFPKIIIGVPYLGVPLIRILLFRVLY